MRDDQAISVLVATFRSPDSVERVVRAVLDQLDGGDELIVIDDGSGDDTPTRLRHVDDPRLTLVVQPNAGVSAARNRAAGLARGQLLVFLDDDEVPTEGWLEAHRAAHGTDRAVVMGRAELEVRALFRTQVIPAPQRKPERDAPDLLVNDSFSVRRSDFEAVGGFDVRFVHGGEDIDLGLRLASTGVSLRVADDAVIRHSIDRTYREFREQRLRRGRASVLLEERHGRALVPSPGALPARDRVWVALAGRSRVATEVACVVLWGLLRVAGALSIWRVQSAAAGRITLMLGLVGRSTATDPASQPSANVANPPEVGPEHGSG